VIEAGTPVRIKANLSWGIPEQIGTALFAPKNGLVAVELEQQTAGECSVRVVLEGQVEEL
jgi:hypothetical protein